MQNLQQYKENPRSHEQNYNNMNESNQPVSTRRNIQKLTIKDDTQHRKRPSSAGYHKEIINIQLNDFKQPTQNISNQNKARSTGKASSKNSARVDQQALLNLKRNGSGSPNLTSQRTNRNENALQVLRDQKKLDNKNELIQFLSHHTSSKSLITDQLNMKSYDPQMQIDDVMQSVRHNNVLSKKNSQPLLQACNNVFKNPNSFVEEPKNERKMRTSNSSANKQINYEQVKGKMACQKKSNGQDLQQNTLPKNLAKKNDLNIKQAMQHQTLAKKGPTPMDNCVVLIPQSKETYRNNTSL